MLPCKHSLPDVALWFIFGGLVFQSIGRLWRMAWKRKSH